MRIVYRGNFGVDFSTESHIAATLDAMGHDVEGHQEDKIPWAETVDACRSADLFLWTSTHGFAHVWDQTVAEDAVRTLNAMLPTAAVHLDLFFGLAREWQVSKEPWFRLRHCFTADGDHVAEFAAAGVNHHWLRPAVYEADCTTEPPRDEYASELAFVGAWQGGYHPEWHGRRELIEWLKATYPGRCAFWPKPNAHAIRGKDLNALYSSVKVVIGDSCFADRSKRYTSDRPYETVGRGGFLVYPQIECVEKDLRDSEHCVYYKPGDWAQLRRTIDHWLSPERDEERERIRRAGQAHVRAHCTYRNRLLEMFDVLGMGCPAPGCAQPDGHGPSLHSNRAGPWEDLRPWSGKAELHWLYACDLDCSCCNRASFLRKPHTRAMTVDDQREFFRQCDEIGWKPYLTIVGGEPTLHPQFETLLGEAIAWAGPGRVQLWSNAYSQHARDMVQLAADKGASVCCETQKPLGAIRTGMVAGWVDDIYVSPADYGVERTHCYQHQSAVCGMGVDAEGYFPCAMGGTMAAMLGAKCRTTRLADLFDPAIVREMTRAMCRNCGLQMYDALAGRVNVAELPRLFDTAMSPTWVRAFEGRR